MRSTADRVLRLFLLKRFFIFSIATLITLLVAEGAARLLVTLAKPAQSHSEAFDRKHFLATHPQSGKTPSVLLIGDSQMDFGLYADKMERDLHEAGLKDLQVVNLAVVGNTPNMSLYLLRIAVKSGYRPALAIMNISPWALNGNYIHKTALTAEGHFLDSYLGRCHYGAEGKKNLDCLGQKNFFMLRYRDFLHEQLSGLSKAVTSPRSKMGYPEVAHVIREVSPRGWTPDYEVFTAHQFEKRFSPTAEDFRNPKTQERFKGFYFSESAVQPVIAYCREQNIPLKLIWFPEHPYRNLYYDHFGFDPELFSRKVAAVAEKSRIGYHDLSNADDDYHHYFNSNHHNVDGAIATTKLVTGIVSNYFQSLKSRHP